MKKFIKLSLLLPLLAVMFASCDKGGTDEGQTLVLVPDKTEIYNVNDQVTFTVTFSGTDVTNQATIKNISANTDLPAGTNTFSSTTTGIYQFRATYDGVESATVTITVKEVPTNIVEIVSDKSGVIPDGEDFATITVIFNGEDVTADARIKNYDTNEYLEPEGNVYIIQAPEGDWEYSINLLAEYDDRVSGILEFGAVKFFKSISLLKFTSESCTPCKTFTTTLNTYLATDPGRVTQIAIHGGDNLSNTLTNSLNSTYEIQYVPTTHWDFEVREIGAIGLTDITTIINDLVTQYEATTLMQTSSTVSGSTATIDIEVWANKEDNYKLAVFLIENDITTGWGTFNNVLRRMASVDELGDDLGTIPANGKVTKQYQFDLLGTTTANTQIVVLTTDSNGKGNNAAIVPVDGTYEYRYE